MMIAFVLCAGLAVAGGDAPVAPTPHYATDVIPTAKGDLKITCVGHGTLMFQFNGIVIHVDPVSHYADYAHMPKADLILVTHEHGDHLDPRAIQQITKADTVLIVSQACADKLHRGIVMKNGDAGIYKDIGIEAVPAYNIVHMRAPNAPYHPKGVGNGYVLTFGNKRVYVAGDTENIPEMSKLDKIDIAFLPMNLPYTMTPEMVADAVRKIHPRIVYPYHTGNTDTSKLAPLLKDEPDVEVRIRKMN